MQGDELHCYLPSNAEGTWEATRTACGGGVDDEDLAIIESTEENNFVGAHLGGIGVEDEDQLWFGKRHMADIWVWEHDNSIKGDYLHTIPLL